MAKRSLFEMDGEFEEAAEACPFVDEAPPAPEEKKKRGWRKPGATTVEIENVGPIKEVSIPVQAGSVVVLRGDNGVGKTTAIESIKAAVTGGKTDVKLTPTDGCEKEGGSIEFNGILMRVGARISKKGTAVESFVMVEGGEAMDTFCDPGIKDPHSADEHRLRAMLAMAGVKIDRDRLEEFLGEEICDAFLVAHRGVLEKPMVELVKLLQRWLQSQAREMKSDADRLEGEIQAIGKVPDDIESSSPTELQATVSARGEHLNRLRGQKKAADDARSMLEGESAIVDVDALTADLEASVGRARDLQAQLDAEREKAAGLRARIASGKEQLARIQRMKEAIAVSVTDNDIADAECLYNEVVELRDRAVLAARQNEENAAKRLRLEKARKGFEKANVLRQRILTMSDSSIGLLSDAVSKFEGWEVSKDLRLMCHHAERGMIPIADHSPGERIQQAIRLMLPTFKTSDDEVPICVVPQKLFEQLDIRGQEDLVRLAKENGLFVVAAQCRKSKSEPSELTVDVLTGA